MAGKKQTKWQHVTLSNRLTINHIFFWCNCHLVLIITMLKVLIDGGLLLLVLHVCSEYYLGWSHGNAIMLVMTYLGSIFIKADNIVPNSIS